MTCTVAALRRYPVKAMGGEDLGLVELDDRGLVGDRRWAVVDAEGRFASLKDTRRVRRRDEVVELAARTASSGVEVVAVAGAAGSWPVDDPALAAELGSRLGVPVHLAVEAEVPHQDAGAVSLVGTASLAWCAERWGGAPDPRRLRANVVVATTEPFEEETWVGRRVRVGEVELDVVERVERCRTIDVAQDGVEPDGRWLRPLGAERDLCLAVYADVVTPGAVRVGDSVRVLD